MLYFEIKKIFSRKSGKVAVIMLTLLLLLSCWFAVNGLADGIGYVNELGEKEFGIAAAGKLRQEKLVWSGVLTEERIAEVIAHNAEIIRTEEYQSTDIQKSNIAYGWMQDFEDIRDLIVSSFCAFRDYDYYKVNSLIPEDAVHFYENRAASLKEWLYGEAKDQFSENEKMWLIEQYEKMETPLYYTYVEGWECLLEYTPTIQMITVLILGFLAAGIFAGEFAWRADSVFFSSYHGRGRAVRAKIAAGFWSITGIYWIMWSLYSGIVLGILGTDGMECLIQSNRSGWKSFYNMTYGQLYLLVSVGGYIGNLFFGFLTMLVSAWTKSAVMAVTVPFILIFLPSFMGGTNSFVVSEVLGLLPDQLLQMNMAVKYFNLYEIGGKVWGAVQILPVIYAVLGAVLVLVMYGVFRRKSVE